jgi:hypothetical protein
MKPGRKPLAFEVYGTQIQNLTACISFVKSGQPLPEPHRNLICSVLGVERDRLNAEFESRKSRRPA